MENPYPWPWVWVLVGMGEGTRKYTRGIPMLFTTFLQQMAQVWLRGGYQLLWGCLPMVVD